ncbi:MarR family winged helix-turn-helix transcriptional regulator [Streptomyces sp. NPDC048111]|uniref:MarR family winged helix-turn-helix transcriptional regulator n=1 Tax=Streptomyces sp. NPDC048111 TaxID=3365500 RepID=UPI003715F5BD
MDRAESSDDDSLHAVAQQVSEAAEALIIAWNGAAKSVVPRLSGLQLEALSAARRHPGINLTGLADRIGATPPAASRLCDRLEAAGLLARRRTSTNRREIELSLTSHGRDVLEAVSELRLAAIGKVLHRVPAAQRGSLLAGLRAFTEAAETAEGVAAAEGTGTGEGAAINENTETAEGTGAADGSVSGP